METTSGVQRRPYHQRKVWRGSLLLHFGEEVGESLEELGQEFDELMTDLDYQKSRLKSFSPQEASIQEEEVRPASPASSEASTGQSSASKHTSSIKSSFRSIKRRFSNRQRSSPLMVRKNDDSASLNSEVFDAKATSEEDMPSNQQYKLPSNQQHKLPSNGKTPEYPLPMAYDQVDSASSSGGLSAPGKISKPPISPAGKKSAGVHRVRSATVSARDAHMIAPPVMVDGEVKREYQYVSPARHVSKIGGKNDNGMAGIFRSSSFAKILGLSENERSSGGVGGGSGRSKEESPLKALYKATVLNECNNKENQNNNSSSRDARRSIVIPALKVT